MQRESVHSSEWIEDTGETERERRAEVGERKKVTTIGRNKRPKQKEKNGTRACESEWMQRGGGRRTRKKEVKKSKKEGEKEQVQESEGGGSESARLDRVAPSQRANSVNCRAQTTTGDRIYIATYRAAVHRAANLQ